jgi:uncharacterized protein (TIGR02145 family)
MISTKVHWIVLVIFLSFSCRKEEVLKAFSDEIEGLTDSGIFFRGRVLGPYKSKGVIWGLTEDPTVENNSGILYNASASSNHFGIRVENLEKGKLYYFRAIALNDDEVAYGSSLTIWTYPPYCGDYPSVEIGGLCWMRENLSKTKYKNGEPIGSDILSPGLPWYCHPAPTHISYYYNHAAVQDSGGLCPDGWHVPTMAEWEILINALGGYSIAGGKLKSYGTKDWGENNADNRNESGFAALPEGYGFLEAGMDYYEDQCIYANFLIADKPFMGIIISTSTAEILSQIVVKDFYRSCRCVKDN